MDSSTSFSAPVRRKTPARTAVLVVFLLAMGAVSISCETQGLETVELEIEGNVFVVEVARSVEEQRRGLMFRRSMAENRGMLFIYEADRRLDFWMKDTYIPLSIAFLSSRGEIVDIYDMMPESERSIQSSRSVRYALELNQGAFERVGAKPGTLVVLPEGLR